MQNSFEMSGSFLGRDGSFKVECIASTAGHPAIYAAHNAHTRTRTYITNGTANVRLWLKMACVCAVIDKQRRISRTANGEAEATNPSAGGFCCSRNAQFSNHGRLST